MNKRENKKELILLAGMEVMKRQGYNGTGVKDIVDAAGVPKGSFYNYFESKEQFAIDAIDYSAAEGQVYAQSVLGDRTKCPLVRLRAFFMSGVNDAKVNNFATGCFLGNMCQEMADSSDVICQKLDSLLSSKTRMIAAVISEGQDLAVVPSAVDAKIVAEFIFNAWEGSLMRAKASKSSEPLDAFMNMLQHQIGYGSYQAEAP